MFCIADKTTIGTGRRNGIFHDGMLLEMWSPRKARRGQAGRRAKLTMWGRGCDGPEGSPWTISCRLREEGVIFTSQHQHQHQHQHEKRNEMSHQRSMIALACACGIALGAVGVPTAVQADPPAACDAGAKVCYFHYIEPDGTKHNVLRPRRSSCYNMTYGAVAGQNRTNTRIYLYKGDCQDAGYAAAYIDKGLSWNDPKHIYYSFVVPD